MRVVLQRVIRGEVRIDGDVASRVGRGYVVLAGFGPDDDEETLTWMADKIVGLRLFPDEDDRMNLDLDAVGGGLLVVSQFTLYGDARKGRRPSFVGAADPEVAIPLYDRFLELLEARAPGRVESGEFGAMMDVELVNDGPVTLILER
ncbi:MAG: D-aminoacyl-tRNA deacylase [Longimicrobiales bacterium]|nr:D-aminoacyl-tRNA deacylase [Longimicrobiales bacterium]